MYGRHLFPFFYYAQALIFAYAHLFNYTHISTFSWWYKPLAVLPHLVGGLYFGWLRVRYGFGAAVVAHSLHNALAIVASLIFPETHTHMLTR